MLETSQTIAIIFVVALLIQFCVERVKELVSGTKVMQYIKAPVWSMAFGILFALMFRLDVFSMLGFTSSIPVIAYILTGLVLSGGAAPIHDLIDKIRAYKTGGAA